MDKHSIPISEFPINQRQERRKRTAGEIASIIGAAAPWLLVPIPIVAALICGACIGTGFICGLQVLRIYAGEQLFEDNGNRRP
jgi:hypothetical protein